MTATTDIRALASEIVNGRVRHAGNVQLLGRVAGSSGQWQDDYTPIGWSVETIEALARAVLAAVPSTPPDPQAPGLTEAQVGELRVGEVFRCDDGRLVRVSGMPDGVTLCRDYHGRVAVRNVATNRLSYLPEGMLLSMPRAAADVQQHTLAEALEVALADRTRLQTALAAAEGLTVQQQVRNGDLCGQIVELGTENRRLREALEFYAIERRYRERPVDGVIVVLADAGRIAQSALAAPPTPRRETEAVHDRQAIAAAMEDTVA